VFDERALAISAGAVGETKCMLGCQAGAAIADIALQEPFQLGISVSDAMQERSPSWMRRASGCRNTCRLFGDVVERVRCAGLTSVQINSEAAAFVTSRQQPRFSVPLFWCHGHSAIRAGKLFDRSHRLSGCNYAGGSVAVGCNVATNCSRAVECA
jgi:hypothetical protein